MPEIKGVYQRVGDMIYEIPIGKQFIQASSDVMPEEGTEDYEALVASLPNGALITFPVEEETDA